MRVGLLTPLRMSPSAYTVAESLRAGPAGLAGIIGLAPRTRAPDALVRVRRSVARHGLSALGRIPAALLRLAFWPLWSRDPSPPLLVTTRAYGMHHGIPTWVVPNADHPAAVSALGEAELDVVVAFAGGILRPVLLDLPHTIFLNAHPGRVPKYRGMDCPLWAVFHDDPIYGTVHRIDRGIDSGEILLEQPLALGRPSSVGALLKASFLAVWDLVPRALSLLDRDMVAFRPQPGWEPAVQWFGMHPSLRAVVQAKLDDGTFFEIQERALRDTSL